VATSLQQLYVVALLIQMAASTNKNVLDRVEFAQLQNLSLKILYVLDHLMAEVVMMTETISVITLVCVSMHLNQQLIPAALLQIQMAASCSKCVLVLMVNVLLKKIRWKGLHVLVFQTVAVVTPLTHVMPMVYVKTILNLLEYRVESFWMSMDARINLNVVGRVDRVQYQQTNQLILLAPDHQMVVAVMTTITTNA